MKKILTHIVPCNKNYMGLCKVLQKKGVIVADLTNRLFDSVESIDPEVLIFPLDNYTQECHDFISQTNKSIVIIIDSIPGGNTVEVIKFLNSKSNIKFVVNKNTAVNITNNIIRYDKLYDKTIFQNLNLERNNKYALLLSSNNDVNQKFTSLLYPNTTYDIVCFNNPNFDHITNLGVLTENDLAHILNTYAGVIDPDNVFQLEAQACGCKYVSYEKLLKTSSIEYVTHTFDCQTQNYDYYLDNSIIPFIEA